MNDDIDAKLLACLNTIFAHHDHANDVQSQDIQQIKQVLKDAGYEQRYVGSDTVPLNPHYSDELLRAISKELSKPRLTGQEYVDAYNRIFKQIIDDEYGPEVQPLEVPTWLVMETARRAAGIDSGGE